MGNYLSTNQINSVQSEILNMGLSGPIKIHWKRLFYHMDFKDGVNKSIIKI